MGIFELEEDKPTPSAEELFILSWKSEPEDFAILCWRAHQWDSVVWQEAFRVTWSRPEPSCMFSIGAILGKLLMFGYCF